MPLPRRSVLRSMVASLLLLAHPLALPACGGEPSGGGWRSGGKAGLGLGSQDPSPLASPDLAREGFALARRVLTGARETGEAKALEAFEGRRVFLTLYGVGKKPVAATGRGKDLADSVEAAARALAEDRALEGGAAAQAVKDGAFRLKIEVPVSAEKKKLKEKEGVVRPRRESVGLQGYYAEFEGKPGWLTGTDVAEQNLWIGKKKGFSGEELRRRLEARAGGDDMPPDSSYMEFQAESWVEGPLPQDPPVRLYRTRPHPETVAPVTADSMLAASIAAADYIERIIRPDGKHLYLYHVLEDRESRSYNMLRHAGTTFALLQAYDRTRWPRYRAAAERSIEYLLAQSKYEKRKGPWGEDFLFVLDGKDAKLGGSGLTLLALAQYTEATGDRRYWTQMQQYARFIVMMQRENGRMNSFYAHEPGMKVSDEENEFYPGEALLGLMRLHAIEANPLWLRTAEKAADYMILERDKGKGKDKVPHDHWLHYGLSYLYHYSKAPHYLEHARLIGQAMESKARGPDHPDVKSWPDLLGAFYSPPAITPGATKIEGISAAIDVLLEAGEDPQWLMDVAVPGAEFLVRQQYTPASSYFAPYPEKVLGGWPEHPVTHEIRNDYVQHSLSGLLGTERHLRAKEGVVVPGGPRWSDHRREGATFAGIPEPGAAPPGAQAGGSPPSP
ncbi:hypothetical protein L6R50_27265 [Myxococcota bacterium]|nr:hypothetical protein [Myxococcota bacterium]